MATQDQPVARVSAELLARYRARQHPTHSRVCCSCSCGCRERPMQLNVPHRHKPTQHPKLGATPGARCVQPALQPAPDGERVRQPPRLTPTWSPCHRACSSRQQVMLLLLLLLLLLLMEP